MRAHIMSILKRLFTRNTKATVQSFVGDPAPARPLYVIGDIHGRDDLLQRLLAQIEAAGDTNHDLIFVGDYVDRGEDSAAVLERLHKISTRGNVTCLMGNHERMLLDFLDDPAKYGRRWIRNGGLQTLASFNVGGLTEFSDPEKLIQARDLFLQRLGPLEKWLRNLRLSFQSGNIFVTHAAAKPDLAIESQTDRTMLWGHASFFEGIRQDGIWVVHGHYIVDAAKTQDGRISIDTGAYATARLTAARIIQGDVSFLTT